jgi:putative membrane protein
VDLVTISGSAHWGEFLPPAAATAAYGIPYALRSRRLAAEGRPVPRWRATCFFAGLALILIAISPPFDRVADRLLAGHMAQHILLGDLAALLVALGLTGPLLQPLLRHRPHVLQRLSHPVVAFGLWAANLYFWHAPGLYQAALRDDLLHSIQHACFFLFGLNMWMALMGPLPKPAWFGTFARLGYVVAVRFTGAILANVLFWSGTVFYPYYASAERQYGITALGDQGAAGAIMMLTESVVTICLFGWLFMRAAAESERKQELIEFAAARDVVLTPERAGRAVAAGRDNELRERIATGTLT